MAASDVSRSWCFTLNNYTTDEEDLLKNLECNYIVFGYEIAPETSTPHLQGFVTFTKVMRLAGVKKLLPRAHWEKAISGIASEKYCKKTAVFFEKDNRKQGARTDLSVAVDLVKQGKYKQLIEEHPETYIRFHNGLDKLCVKYQKPRSEKPIVTWLHGPTGVGKTKYIYDNHKAEDVWISGRDLKFWDGYENQPVVLLDDFRKDFCTFHELLRILDRYPYRVNVKGSSRELNSTHIYITSPYSPAETYNTREDIDQLLRRIDKIIYLNFPIEDSLLYSGDASTCDSASSSDSDLQTQNLQKELSQDLSQALSDLSL